MLLSFPKNIRVKNLLPGIEGGSFAHNITWSSVNGASEYNVYRSLVPYGDFELIGSTEYEGITDVSQEFILDSEPQYRVSTVNGQSQEGSLSEPQCDENNLIYNTTVHTHRDSLPTGSKPNYRPGINPMPSDFMRRYQFTMIRRKLLWQLEDIGDYVWLFKRVQASMNNVSDGREYGRRTDYYTSIKILIRMVSFEETKRMAEYGLRRDRIPRSWTIWTPRLHNGDVVIDAKNRRYEIKGVTPHYWKGLQISHQDFDMIELPYTDYAYKNPQLRVEGNPL